MKRPLCVISGLLFALSALFVIGCGPDEPPQDSGAVRQIYEVRGEVRSLPGQSEVASALYLRHEAIPEFIGIEGDVVGMPTMTMPFPVAKDVDLSGLERGAKVRATLEVTWDGDPPYQLTEIAVLPADTELDFESD